MFSKAQRFNDAKLKQNQSKELIKNEVEIPKSKLKAPATVPAKNKASAPSSLKKSTDTQSQCSSTRSIGSFVTPKPVKKILPTGTSSSTKKPLIRTKLIQSKVSNKDTEELLKNQEVEIRNKDLTIKEYAQQIEDLKKNIANLQKQVKPETKNNCDNLQKQFSEISIKENIVDDYESNRLVEELNTIIHSLEEQCNQLEHEVSSKQVELSSLEEIICIRDSLCKDLQDKLTSMETSLEETKQRLEMVKGHHSLALEANESIRREYKAELETMKMKFEDEKQAIVNRAKIDQEALKSKYLAQLDLLQEQLTKDKNDVVLELHKQVELKEMEMKAKLEQINEATNEKLKLCEIQFEERFRSLQEHWSLQEDKVHYLEKESIDLKHSLNISEERNLALQQELSALLEVKGVKDNLDKEIDTLKEESKKKHIEFENEINRLMVEVDKAEKENIKYEVSLNVTRDIVHVLTVRLRESDGELQSLEEKIREMEDSKSALEAEVATYKNKLTTSAMECEEYKEALVNILKSKASLAKEHTRIMEHNVSLIECLQNVEMEAYRELGSIKNELIEDVELIKKESKTQINILKEEVEKKRMLCELATEQAGQAAAAAEQSRELLAHAAHEISRLEAENQRATNQIQDQQSLVVELSLLRQENEELAMTVATQSSIIEKMKKDIEQNQLKPKSPSVMRKSHKIGKENTQILISPLRERNH